MWCIADVVHPGALHLVILALCVSKPLPTFLSQVFLRTSYYVTLNHLRTTKCPTHLLHASFRWTCCVLEMSSSAHLYMGNQNKSYRKHFRGNVSDLMAWECFIFSPLCFEEEEEEDGKGRKLVLIKSIFIIISNLIFEDFK